jgi:hypothetical protein
MILRPFSSANTDKSCIACMYPQHTSRLLGEVTLRARLSSQPSPLTAALALTRHEEANSATGLSRNP